MIDQETRTVQIHQPDGNPMRAFARLAGVPGVSMDPAPEMAGYDAADGRRLTAAETSEMFRLYLEEFPAAAPGLAAELGPSGATVHDWASEPLQE